MTGCRSMKSTIVLLLFYDNFCAFYNFMIIKRFDLLIVNSIMISYYVKLCTYIETSNSIFLYFCILNNPRTMQSFKLSQDYMQRNNMHNYGCVFVVVVCCCGFCLFVACLCGSQHPIVYFSKFYREL